MQQEFLEFGRLTITPIADGHTSMSNSVFPKFSADRANATLDGRFQLPISAFLIQGMGKNLLVDTGSAGNFGPDSGRFTENFAATGLGPDAIDTIFLTHLHSDHYGGLRGKTGEAAFPRARLVISAVEWQASHDPALIEAMSQDDRAALTRVHAALEPYRDRTDLVHEGDEVMAGLQVLALPGHTAGHSGLAIRSGQQELLILGDVVHCPAYQLPNPTWSVIYDDDQAMAAETRIAALSRAARDGSVIAAAHLGADNFTKIEAQGAGFRPV